MGACSEATQAEGQQGVAERGSLSIHHTLQLTIWSKKRYFPNLSHELEAKAYILWWFTLASAGAESLNTEGGVEGSNSLCFDSQPSTVKHQEVHHNLLHLTTVENRLIRFDLSVFSALPVLISAAKNLQARRARSSRQGDDVACRIPLAKKSTLSVGELAQVLLGRCVAD